MVRSMMSHADLPNSFWGHALLTTAYTLNRVPSKKVDKTPYEIWSRKKPHMSYMKIWGCKVYVKRQISTKLEHKSDNFLFVGYPKETRGYYFYNPSEGKVFVARTRVFLEKDFISKGISGRKVKLEEIQESQSIDTPMEELEQETQLCRIMDSKTLVPTWHFGGSLPNKEAGEATVRAANFLRAAKAANLAS
ncbi:hypothetical protein KIW84_043608 [Lathyrus oleraceus]|uniref:Retroviral polymerase SH3-like domain-containing protein n=1 Tax=Pisum sativum TaxID=3888 RepID=A0A9D4XE50_PEA|nr:hypothetical protein KIW84_043608 [Pisum sativum]